MRAGGSPNWHTGQKSSRRAVAACSKVEMLRPLEVTWQWRELCKTLAGLLVRFKG
jgi:hypothetical protein